MGDAQRQRRQTGEGGASSGGTGEEAREFELLQFRVPVVSRKPAPHPFPVHVRIRPSRVLALAGFCAVHLRIRPRRAVALAGFYAPSNSTTAGGGTNRPGWQLGASMTLTEACKDQYPHMITSSGLQSGRRMLEGHLLLISTHHYSQHRCSVARFGEQGNSA